MLRWLGPRKAPEPPPNIIQMKETEEGEVTDDPLAALDSVNSHHHHHHQHHHHNKQIYSVSRSVYLPRVTLKNTLNSTSTGGGVNPLFQEVPEPTATPAPAPPSPQRPLAKSSSSGYGSSLDPLYTDQHKLIVEQHHPGYVKSIRVCSKVPSSGSSGGSLGPIPEGRVELPVPKPIWPQDSLLDENQQAYSNAHEASVRDILVGLLNSISATMETGTELAPEQVLRTINDEITSSIQALKASTEEEMKKLCINLSNCRKINSVLKAFGNSTDEALKPFRNSTSSSQEETSGSQDEIYHLPSGSSSSGFSECGRVGSGAILYGTLLKNKNGMSEKLMMGSGGGQKTGDGVKKSSLRDVNDNKPSVWEQYYGMKATPEGELKHEAKPTDVPLFPGGRPEADFTLDMPRSEMLLQRMKEDKKWRFRCRLLTTFLGLVFFLLSVMAVSLMLTRGKRMFGSMM